MTPASKENAAQRIFSGGRAKLLVAHAEAATTRTDVVWTPQGTAGTARVWQSKAAQSPRATGSSIRASSPREACSARRMCSTTQSDEM
jgi:hypothetical protein